MSYQLPSSFGSKKKQKKTSTDCDSTHHPKYRRFQSPATHSALSFSLLVFLHRLLSRFFTTLRANLLLPSARTFRKRHPRTTKLLTSRISPALGASIAGLALAVHPEGEARNGIALWVLFKSLEYGFSMAELREVWGERPWVCIDILGMHHNCTGYS